MRLIDGDALAEIFSEGIKKVAEQYGVYSSELGVLWGAHALLQSQPTIESRMKGKWIEKEVHENPKAAGIEEWQSCKCSVCGRYDTRPYSYYFDEPHYCSWCGADMRGEQDALN